MKQADFKPCVFCGQGVMHTGSPVFYRVSVEYLGVDLGAVRRQHGLELMLGSPVLAQAMGPDEDLTQPLAEKKGLHVCLTCAMEPQVIAALLECAGEE